MSDKTIAPELQFHGCFYHQKTIFHTMINQIQVKFKPISQIVKGIFLALNHKGPNFHHWQLAHKANLKGRTREKTSTVGYLGSWCPPVYSYTLCLKCVSCCGVLYIIKSFHHPATKNGYSMLGVLGKE